MHYKELHDLYNQGDKMKEYEMGDTCSMHGENEKFLYFRLIF